MTAKQTPIQFSPAMVLAVLAGRKTQTRRLVKWPFEPAPQADQLDNLGDCITLVATDQHGKQHFVECPYGGEGDTLWVRERHCYLDVTAKSMPRGAHPAWYVTVEYSDGSQRETWVEEVKPKQTRQRGEIKWRPGMFMHRWASRITLAISQWPDAQRLQDITYDDILAEGFVPDPNAVAYQVPQDHQVHRDAGRDWYSDLWDSLNKKPGTRWADNPWVWVNHFKKA